jgi:membrane fusion protein (multidrug efflux system)
MKNKIGILIVLALIVIFGFFAYKWIKHRKEYVITDAVFVEADGMTNISFKRVSGKILKVLKEEGDKVKEGEVIAILDDTDYKTELASTEKKIESLKHKKMSLEKKLERIKDEIKININIQELTKKQLKKKLLSLKAKINQIEAQIKQVEKDRNRFKKLSDRELLPKVKFEEVDTKLKVLINQKKALEEGIKELLIGIKKAEEGIKLAKNKEKIIPEIKESINALKKQIEALEEKKKDILNKISYTRLKAPFNGVIAKRFVYVGSVIKSGMPVYSIIPENSLYINVLLEETKLEGVKVGAPARIKIDAYPDRIYEGIVEKIEPASAAKFALVPRDISAGEFTKVAQRIPVRIKITKGDLSILRVGMGGEVEIKREK